MTAGDQACARLTSNTDRIRAANRESVMNATPAQLRFLSVTFTETMAAIKSNPELPQVRLELQADAMRATCQLALEALCAHLIAIREERTAEDAKNAESEH